MPFSSRMLRPHAYWLVPLGSYVALFCGVFTAILVLRPFSGSQTAEIDNLLTIAGPLALFPLAYGWIRIPGQGRRAAPKMRRLPALFLVLGATTDVIGQAIWTYYAQVLHQGVPFPSLDDVSYLCTYPLLLTGILLMPGGRSSAVSRSRATIEGLIVMATAFTFSWYFVVGPTVLQGGESLLAKVVGTAYPLGDLLLIGALVVLALRSDRQRGGLVVTTLFIGLGAMVVADYVFDVATLHGTYQTGQLVDVLWPLADMLIACAAIILLYVPMTRSRAGNQHAARKRSVSIVRLTTSLLPYLLVPAMGILDTTLLIVHGDNRLMSGVVVGSICLVVLVMLQQVLATLENRSLSVKLQDNNAKLQAANERLQALATTDPLTDLANHRGIASTLSNEVERAGRHGRNVSILFIDIDHFKNVNDTLGHAAGDAVLRDFTEAAHSALRAGDILGRWGGEEFVALLPETDREQGATVAERIREKVASSTFRNVSALRVTCSIGVATYPDDASTVNDLISQADAAMYAAKRLGRNQVRGADEPLDVAAMTSAGIVTAERASAMVTVEALAALIDARDHYTAQHTAEVAHLSRRIAVAMGLASEEIRTIDLAARLHDIGKVAIPDAILLKPGQLTSEEWQLVRVHPLVGAEVLAQIPRLENLAPIVRSHHERFGGDGYPDGLRREQIPIGSRILAVADAFAAMTSDRPYRRSMRTQAALDELAEWAGRQFDPDVVEALQVVLAVSEGRVA